MMLFDILRYKKIKERTEFYDSLYPKFVRILDDYVPCMACGEQAHGIYRFELPPISEMDAALCVFCSNLPSAVVEHKMYDRFNRRQ